MVKNMVELPQRIDGYVMMAKRISMMLYGGVWAMNYRENRLLYVSDYLKELCRISDVDVKNGGLDVLYNGVCADDWDMIKSRSKEIMMGVSRIKGGENQ